jgi:hypothetical protein
LSRRLLRNLSQVTKRIMRSLLLSNSFSNKWPEIKEAKDSNQMLMKIVHSL